MINSDQAAFSIGLRVPRCTLTVELNKFGKDHNVLELDDITTKSWARLDANLTAPDKLVVHQLGPRRLWDEAEAGLARFGMTMTADTQTVWIDEPNTIVRAFTWPGESLPYPWVCSDPAGRPPHLDPPPDLTAVRPWTGSVPPETGLSGWAARRYAARIGGFGITSSWASHAPRPPPATSPTSRGFADECSAR